MFYGLKSTSHLKSAEFYFWHDRQKVPEIVLQTSPIFHIWLPSWLMHLSDLMFLESMTKT